MLNVYLFQPQYKVLFKNKDQYWLPYSVGCLWAYANQFAWVKENFSLENIFFARDSIEELIDNLDHPSICGFSCYVWNEQYCLQAAKKIKKKFPNCKILFGGPQVNIDMLYENKFIDSIMLGEGEKNFTKVLDSIINNIPIQDVYYAERIVNLSELPSPYTSGVFDKMIKDHPNCLWQMTFETNRGCPFSCTFCDWGSLTYAKIKQYDFKRIEEEILWIKKNPVSYVFLADANFGIFKERDLKIANLLHTHLDQSSVDTVNIQFTKNSNSVVIEIAKTLGRLYRGITLSVQSMNEKTLVAIKRKNMEVNKLENMLKMINEAGLTSYSELILGLPEETLESWKTGITNLLEIGQHNNIDVWFSQMLKNSEMSSEKSINRYGIKTTRVKDYIFIFNDFDPITEYIDIVSETNTMTKEEMVEAYMYSWVIIHFHINGYTQILSKYARNKGVSFRKFYDLLIDNISLSEIIYSHYNLIKESIDLYLRGSNTSKKISAHSWMYNKSHNIFYRNKEHVFRIGEKTFRDLFDMQHVDVLIFQKNFIYDNSKKYPIKQKLNFNYNEMNSSNLILYVFDSQFKPNNDHYAERRTNPSLVKNLVYQF